MARPPPPKDPKHALGARELRIPPLGLRGCLRLPLMAGPVIVFVQVGGGRGGDRRNRFVADAFNRYGLGSLLFDLLTPGEEADRRNVLDLPRLAARGVEAVRWLERDCAMTGRAVGLFGAGAGSAAALAMAAEFGDEVGAVVLHGGRPDQAEAVLGEVRAPTLLIVGGADAARELDRRTFARLSGPKALEIMACASHLFTEPGAIDMPILHATRWFQHYLCSPYRQRLRFDGTPN